MSYSGIILAGGKSSRMGNDKALMELKGVPMIQHVADVLKSICNEIIIASNNTTHHTFGDTGVSDNYTNSGPKAGLEAGLRIAQNDRCFVLSCDTPFVHLQILEKLTLENTDAVVATCSNQVHPLIGIYTKTSLSVLEEQLKQGDFKMYHLLERLHTTYVDFPVAEIEAFQNINTQEEWNQSIEK